MRSGEVSSTAALALTAALAAALAASCGSEPPLNLWVITLDTTRADRLGAYGNEQIETPNIDRLASEGVLYERCFSTVPITLPSHLSIFTGTYPVFHGVRENGGFYVAPELSTMAEVLQQDGYETAAFIGAYPLDSQTGLDQGFDLYDDHYPSSVEQGKHPALRGFFDERPAAEVVRPALQWLAARRGSEPFFLWTHFFDPHQPQIPPSPYRERYAHNLYDGEIASVDEAIGQLLLRLQQQGELERTLVVLTADHGESLGEHGELTHALLAFSSTLRVPLIVRDPRSGTAPGARVSTLVSTVDILPTVLRKLGIGTTGIHEQLQGDALPQSDREPKPRREVFSETLYGALLHGWSPLERLTVSDWAYIAAPQPRLYHLSSDPHELHDLTEEQPGRASAMAQRLAERRNELAEGGPNAAEGSISPEKRARLEALGYLAPSGAASAHQLTVSGDLPDPHDAIAVFREMNEGKQLSEQGQADLAVAVLEHARQTDPSNPSLSFYLANAYQQLGAAEQMRLELQRLLDLAPDHLGARVLLAEALHQAGDLQASLTELRRARELDPRNEATTLLLAHRLEDAGHPEEAITAYRELLDLAPSHALARNGLATLLYTAGRTSEAVRELEEVRRLQPFFPPALLNLAVIAHDQGDAERALALTEQTLALRPTYGLAHEVRARSLRMLGAEAAQTQAAWRRAAQFAASEAARQRALEKLP